MLSTRRLKNICCILKVTDFSCFKDFLSEGHGKHKHEMQISGHNLEIFLKTVPRIIKKQFADKF